MCLVALAHRVFADAPLVVAANRDEFFARPSAPAAWWSFGGVEIFGGRDLEKGGTWLGVTRGGRLAVVTNVRDPGARKIGPNSRGFLVRDALATPSLPLAIDRDSYPSFNLLEIEGDDAFYLRDDAAEPERVAPGVHGLSNLRIDVSWPKVERARRVFGKRESVPSVEDLFRMLADDMHAPDEELPATGVPLEVERALSSPFVRMPAAAYGTRSSTVVVRDARGFVTFEERTWNERGELDGTVRETWRVPAADG